MTEMLEVQDPSDGEQIGKVELIPWDTIDRWLDEMVRLHRPQSALPAHRRIDILREARAAMKSRRDELALLIAREGLLIGR